MKKTIVMMGPQHPALPEPVVLDLVLRDELVIDAIPTIGYVHRGLESLVEKVEFLDFAAVAERVCGICSFMHGMGYCLAIEEIMKIEVPERARHLRIFWAELSRITSHTLWLGLAADALGFENLFMHCWRIREQLLDIFEETTGARIIFGVNKIGGVKRDIPDARLQALVERLSAIGEQMAEVRRVFTDDRTIRHRLSGTGVLSREDALAAGAVGPMARASGLAQDVRTGGSYLYDKLGFEPIVETAGDCMARCEVRLREIAQSIELIKRVVGVTPEEGGPLEAPVLGFPKGEAFIRLEQPRGEVVYYVKAIKSKNLERFRVRTPTFANIPAMLKLVKGCQLADVPTIILTIDPCISCTER
jgi:ech hydrogenase subunit E